MSRATSHGSPTRNNVAVITSLIALSLYLSAFSPSESCYRSEEVISMDELQSLIGCQVQEL